MCVCRRVQRSEGDVPDSMSGGCGSSVDGVLYVFGGHQARGNTNTVRLYNDTNTIMTSALMCVSEAPDVGVSLRFTVCRCDCLRSAGRR